MTRTETTADERKGWAASIVFHALVIAALFFIHLRSQMPMPEFVDMSWGGAAAPSGAMSVSPQALEASARRLEKNAQEDNVALPTRTPSSFPEEAVNLSSSKKTVNPDAMPNYMPSEKQSGDERKATVSPASPSAIDVKPGATGRGGGSAVAAPFGSGGGGAGEGVSYGIQWSGNGTRRLESGALPAYPSGVNREAQIKLKLVVMPSGGVKSAQPLQKGETRLENAALKAVRLWKFDALQSSQPAVDQSCVVTFNFKLK